MNTLTLAKCSNIMKDPFNPYNKNIFYILKNKLRTFMSLKDCENFFLDFSPYTFPTQAKQIFDEVGYGLKKGMPEMFAKNLNENVYYALRDEKSSYHKLDNDYLVSLFPKTFDWTIVQSRTLYLSEVLDDYTHNHGQITLKYSTDSKKDNYIVFERPLSNNYSFYCWKIFILNYEYFKK